MNLPTSAAFVFLLLLHIPFASNAFSSDRESQATTRGVEMTMPTYLYKIVTPAQWKESQSKTFLSLPSIDTDFIHLAEEGQVAHVIEKFWKEKTYVILKVKTDTLPGRLVHEANPGGTTLYYHLYEGHIPITSVEACNCK